MQTEDKISICLRELSEGSKDAFTTLYNMYSGKCISFALKLTADEDTARDILHDVFVKIWLRKEMLCDITSFEAYLMRICYNEAMKSYGRKKLCRKYRDVAIATARECLDQVDEERNYEELMLTVMSAIARMPEQRRNVFLMSRLKGLSNSRIALRTKSSKRTVKKHISNALADIREKIRENFNDEIRVEGK